MYKAVQLFVTYCGKPDCVGLIRPLIIHEVEYVLKLSACGAKRQLRGFSAKEEGKRHAMYVSTIGLVFATVSTIGFVLFLLFFP